MRPCGECEAEHLAPSPRSDASTVPVLRQGGHRCVRPPVGHRRPSYAGTGQGRSASRATRHRARSRTCAPAASAKRSTSPRPRAPTRRSCPSYVKTVIVAYLRRWDTGGRRTRGRGEVVAPHEPHGTARGRGHGSLRRVRSGAPRPVPALRRSTVPILRAREQCDGSQYRQDGALDEVVRPREITVADAAGATIRRSPEAEGHERAREDGEEP